MIPIGINNTQINILDKNVLKFDSYIELSFEKFYTADFNNSTMFSYFYYQASALNAKMTAFYGIGSEYGDQNFFYLNETYYSMTDLVRNGQGLTNSSKKFGLRWTILILMFAFLFS